MSETKFMFECPLCGMEFQDGPHLYEGRTCSGYEIRVCKGCYDGNWDGWNSSLEDKIFAILEEKGIEPPKRNEKGWLPRDF